MITALFLLIFCIRMESLRGPRRPYSCLRCIQLPGIIIDGAPLETPPINVTQIDVSPAIGLTLAPQKSHGGNTQNRLEA